MFKKYNPKRTRNIFNPKSEKPFKLSRSKIENFLKCPKCFYLDRRLGIAQPPSFPFNLNLAVDTLLKKEFDIHRAENESHPLMENYGLESIVPFQCGKIDEWRENFKGITFHHEPTNLIISGAVDDVWINQKTEELIVVDYKATSKDGQVDIHSPWQIVYKRQMEIYQWLLRKNDFRVDDVGYFVYCNGRTDLRAFDSKLEFDVDLIPYKGNDEWIEKTLVDIKDCLMSDEIPEGDDDCDFCKYREVTEGL